MKITVNLQGLNRMQSELHRALEEEVDAATQRVHADASDRCPVDTGNLKNSIEHETNGLVGRVNVGAEYGAAVEFGTSRSPAQSFLTPALEAERERFEKAVGEVVARLSRG